MTGIGTRPTPLGAYDRELLNLIDAQAIPLPPDWLINPAESGTLPKKKSYSKDAEFRRHQGTLHTDGFGCMSYAMLHITDILKDWEHPYTPAVSFHSNDWYWWRYHDEHDGEKPTLADLADHGWAPEGLCHTNWDTEMHCEQTPDGIKAVWVDPTAEAASYNPLSRIKIEGSAWHAAKEKGEDGLSPSVEEIKWLLIQYGPIWSIGKEHAKVIAGYDDSSGHFTILDSYAHLETGGDNLTLLAYEQVGPGDFISSFTEAINIASPERAFGRFAYSARIAIEGGGRGDYEISVGVEGKDPLVVWTPRGRGLQNQYGSETPAEPARKLAIDVPLPEYASAHWPPSDAHRWFVRVEDHDREGESARLTEFTLAKRYANACCQTIGRYRTKTYGGPLDPGVTIPDPEEGAEFGAATFFVPAGASVKRLPPASGAGTNETAYVPYRLALTPGTPANGKQPLTASLLHNGVALPGATVDLYRLKWTATTNANKPSKWVRIASAVTTGGGKCSFEVPAPAPAGRKLYLGSRYYAVALRAVDGEYPASSDAVRINRSDLGLFEHSFGVAAMRSMQVVQDPGPAVPPHPEW